MINALLSWLMPSRKEGTIKSSLNKVTGAPQMDSPVTRGLGDSLLHFQGALCDGLADYNAQIQALKAEMEDATRIADALRCGSRSFASCVKT